MEKNHRRNQIVAQRTVEKLERDHITSIQPDPVLWRRVFDALEHDRQTRIYLGHIDGAARTAEGLLAARELQLRGTKLQLPL